MKILKAIATPFVAIWRWIKETAWVQPLLIVGCIFAVIFSIPYISQGIQNLSKTSEDALAYYKAHLLSMNGAYKGAESNDAEKFLAKIDSLQDSWKLVNSNDSSEASKAEAQETVDEFKRLYGEKFFFVLAKSSCEACKEISDALEYLESNQSEYGISNYKIYSIIADQDLDDDDKEYKEKSAFQMINERQGGAFETIYKSGYYGYYANNLEGSLESYQDKLEKLHKDVSSFEVPLILMFDISEDAKQNKSTYAISQVFFTLSKDNKIDRALELADCWLYRGDTFKRSTMN